MYKLNIALCIISFIVTVICGNIPPPPISIIHKCCEEDEILDDKLSCIYSNDTNNLSKQNKVKYVIGKPLCHPSTQFWKIYQYEGSCDKLTLLNDGKLRHHYLSQNVDERHTCNDELNDDEKEYYDFPLSDYCLNEITTEDDKRLTLAIVCMPKDTFPWHDLNFIFRRVLNPFFCAISVICFLIVGIVYFVLPQLCDLVGNIVTTIAVCLIFGQISDIIRVFVEFHSEFSYLISDSVTYVCSLGAFFWLNSLGYYVWKTFRSRNVFLRVTDGTKYCYYSLYVWMFTLCMASMALFAHLVLNTGNLSRKKKEVSDGAIAELGAAVFFTTILCSIFVNIFFCLSTVQIINRMSTYGRIHHKLRLSFQLFVKILIILTIKWFFFVLSWFPMNAFFYIYVLVNVFQSFAFLYVTVLSLKKVRFLLKKACCHEKCIFSSCRSGDVSETADWGEEMMAMNISIY